MAVECKVLQFCLRLERAKVKLFLENIKRIEKDLQYYSLPSSHKTYYVSEIKITEKPNESMYKNLLYLLVYLLLDIGRFVITQWVASPGT